MGRIIHDDFVFKLSIRLMSFTLILSNERSSFRAKDYFMFLKHTHTHTIDL